MPYILNTKKEIKELLREIGASCVDDLYAHLPPEVKLKKSLDLPAGLSEQQVRKKIKGLCSRNVSLEEFNSFLGAGCYDHYIPSALPFIVNQPQFVTAYTSYQAESSQGILQAIYEYQSYICLLTGMDVSNASLFDGASSFAEAVLMSLRLTRKKKVIISAAIHPEYRETLQTYLSGFDFSIEEVGFNKEGFIDREALSAALDQGGGCFAFQSPNFFGLIEDASRLASLVKEKEALTVMVTNPFSLAIFKEPSSQGVDIVCGDGQALGGNTSLGGPSFGFLAARKQYLRQMPGRIVGKTQDLEGKVAYCLTLQAREQHIRREKATSNICSNQALNAIGAAVYLSLLGKEGFRDMALYSFNLAQYLYARLGEIKEVKLPFPRRIFNEFVWEIKDAKDLINKLYKKKIIAGLYLGERYPQLENCILSCCTEKKTREDIDNFIEAIKEILHSN
ncbi:MAG: aminomethyl-transferring glycine dehydrogenase subunit GcvPA [Candidatus Omnitrophota bacterium]|nr:MAG: aminomethyl-transferring glycine dehydrogenase subunit GcvPA [Candidatus Omnitrophota bacterium]